MNVKKKATECSRQAAYQSIYEGYITGWNDCIDEAATYLHKYLDAWQLECFIKYMRENNG